MLRHGATSGLFRRAAPLRKPPPAYERHFVEQAAAAICTSQLITTLQQHAERCRMMMPCRCALPLAQLQPRRRATLRRFRRLPFPRPLIAGHAMQTDDTIRAPLIGAADATPPVSLGDKHGEALILMQGRADESRPAPASAYGHNISLLTPPTPCDA